MAKRKPAKSKGRQKSSGRSNSSAKKVDRPARRRELALSGAAAELEPILLQDADGDDDVLPPPRVAFPVVGIGASAGGLEAFMRLLKALPQNPRVAIVIVQHLAPEYESALPELLG